MVAAASRSKLASPEQWCEYERICRLMLGHWTWMLPVATHDATPDKYLSPEEAVAGAKNSADFWVDKQAQTASAGEA